MLRRFINKLLDGRNLTAQEMEEAFTVLTGGKVSHVQIGAFLVMLEKQGILTQAEKDAIVNDGVLFCSGMIAGEGLVGILLAILAVFGLNSAINLSEKWAIPAVVSNIGGLVLFGVIILTLLKFSLWKKRK